MNVVPQKSSNTVLDEYIVFEIYGWRHCQTFWLENLMIVHSVVDVGGPSTSRVEMLLVILIYSVWNREGYISSRATYWTNESKARKIQHFWASKIIHRQKLGSGVFILAVLAQLILWKT
jgi:hypothetical protein